MIELFIKAKETISFKVYEKLNFVIIETLPPTSLKQFNENFSFHIISRPSAGSKHYDPIVYHDCECINHTNMDYFVKFEYK